MQSILEVADNSGAKRVICIKVLGGSHHMVAKLGDVIVVSIKEAIPGGKVKKGEVYKGVIVRTKTGVVRADGSTIKFNKKLGDVIVVSIKEAIPGGKVKKGEVYKGVIVRTKTGVVRADGSTIKFNKNALVLLNKQNEPIGTRVFGPVTRELRAKKYVRIMSLAEEVL